MSAKNSESSVAKIREVFDYFNRTVNPSDPVRQSDRFEVHNKLIPDLKPFDADLMSRARVIDATPAGTSTIELDIGTEYANKRGNICWPCLSKQCH